MKEIQPILFDINEEINKGNNGDCFSCYIVGRSFDSAENGVDQDLKQAVYWYEKGAQLGDPRCIYGLGACYYFGDGVEKDLEEAYELFVKAYPKLILLEEQEKEIPQKQAFTIFCIGAYYYFGLGDIKVDKNKAFELINKSAMMGHIAGIYDLGANFYYNGVGVKKDEEKAKYYLKLASNYGLIRAKKKLKEYGYEEIDIDIIKKNYKAMIENKQNIKIDSIYIEQNNAIDKLIFTSDDEIHQLKSCSKLLIAMAVGLAIDKGLITLETEVYSALKNVVTIKKENIEKIQKWAIKDLLLHQTGYETQMMSERFIENIDKNSLLEYSLNYNLPYNSGERFAYNNVEPFIISVFFKEKLNIDIIDFIQENIFEKLDIKDYRWEKYGKYCPGGTGLYLKHSDFHKIGKLLLDNGMYNNVPIIPNKWIEEMTKLQIYTPTIYKKERVLPKIGVGYYTFISRNGYVFRDGSEGQYIILNKKENLLITIMSSEKEMKNITEIFRGVI